MAWSIYMFVWNRNLEHEGIQFKSESKPDKVTIEKLKENGFRWSGIQKIWYAKETPYRVDFLNSIAVYGGEVGEKLSIEEEVERKVERAGARAIRYEERAEKAQATGEALLDQAHKMGDCIPFGQPILVGHYSEGRDRRYRDRIWNKTGKGIETLEKAKEYEHKAATAEKAVDRLFNTGTTLRRIEKLEAEWRSYYRTQETHDKYVDLGCSDKGVSRKILENAELEMERIEKEIAYWKQKIEESGVKVWKAEDFKKGERIIAGGSRATIERINKKSMTVKYDTEWMNHLDVTKVMYHELGQKCKMVVE